MPYVGKKVKVMMVNQMKMISGTVVKESKDLWTLLCQAHEDAKPRVINVVKSNIAFFEDEASDLRVLEVLACQNQEHGCRGVRYVYDGEAPPQKRDYDKFMNCCPVRCDSCECGTIGDLASVDRNKLAAIIGDTVFGDYPTESFGKDEEESEEKPEEKPVKKKTVAKAKRKMATDKKKRSIGRKKRAR